MVRVSAPALSLDASGTLAGAMVFSKWKGRNYVRSHVIPANPKTGPQIGVRSMFKFLSQYWTSQSALNKATWLLRAAENSVSEFNAYVSYNQFRWRNFLGPSKAFPAAEVATAPTAPTATAVAGVRQITLTITKGANAPDWGYMIFRSPTTTFTPAFSNCVATIQIIAGGNGLYVDTPLVAGAYFYMIKGFMADGKLGSISTEYTATVT